MKLTKKEFDEFNKKVLVNTFEKLSIEEQEAVNKFFYEYMVAFSTIVQTAKIVEDIVKKNQSKGE